jgi:replicative DNA helicase
MQVEKPLPNYLDAERSILGAILIDNFSLSRTMEKGLKPDDFFLPEHQRIFEVMHSMEEKRRAIDLITLTEDLHRAGKLEAAGGASYLAQLVDGVPRISNIEHYTQIVKDKAVLRRLIYETDAIQQRAFEAADSVEQIVNDAESFIFKLADERIRTGLIGIKELVQENFERLEKIFTEGRRVTGLSTGYFELDNLTSGLQPSELIILAARPSMGKTALALNLAENVAVRDKQPVAIFSLEMSKESLLQRLIASFGRVDAHKFRTGHLGRDDWRKMVEALNILAQSPISIDDSGANTVFEMIAKARRMKKDKGLALVIVDYMQLIVAHGRFSNRNEEVSQISRSLKAMAKELKVPVVVLSQLTRAPEKEDRRPQLSDLRESGAIEQDADVVIFIHRPNAFKFDETPEERAKAEIHIAKQRNGPTDRMNFVFLNQFTRFEEAAPESWSQE